MKDDSSDSSPVDHGEDHGRQGNRLVMVFEVAREATKVDISTRRRETLFGQMVAAGKHANAARQDQAPGTFLGAASGLKKAWVGEGRREDA